MLTRRSLVRPSGSTDSGDMTRARSAPPGNGSDSRSIIDGATDSVGRGCGVRLHRSIIDGATDSAGREHGVKLPRSIIDGATALWGRENGVRGGQAG